MKKYIEAIAEIKLVQAGKQQISKETLKVCEEALETLVKQKMGQIQPTHKVVHDDFGREVVVPKDVPTREDE